MAEAIEPFANISAPDLLENGSTHHGWVRKKNTSGLKLWEAGWPWFFMILRTGYLYLYKSSEDDNFCGTIPLEKYSVCDAQEVSKYKWSFKLIHGSYSGETLFFAVDSELDLKKWKEVIIEEQDNCWPVVPNIDKTEEKKWKSPLPRPPAPDPPTPGHFYINARQLTQNPLVEESHAHPQPSTSVSGPQHETRRKVLPVPPRQDNKTTQPQHNKPKTKPKPKTLSRYPGLPVPKALHSHKTMTGLRKSSSEACLTQPGYDDVVKQLGSTAFRSFEVGDISPSARGPSTVGVTNQSFNPKPLGRGIPDGRSFNEEYCEVNSLSGIASTLVCDMERKEAESVLQNRPGIYLLRRSDKAQAGMVLSVCGKDGVKHHQILYEKTRGYALSPKGLRFRRIEDLVNHHYDSYVPYE